MTAWFRAQGYVVHHKRVGRILRTMGLETLSAKPRTRPSQPGHRLYPSLRRGVPITRVNQVGSTDLTDIGLQGGFVSLVAILDGCSQYVLSWAVSITLEVGCCLDALEHAFGVAPPEVFHRDQGAPCTSTELTTRLETAGIRIRRDGRGRALENVLGERLWRPVTYEAVEVKDDATPREAARGLAQAFGFYNSQRLHQARDYQTPAAVYGGAYLEQAIFIFASNCLDHGVHLKRLPA